MVYHIYKYLKIKRYPAAAASEAAEEVWHNHTDGGNHADPPVLQLQLAVAAELLLRTWNGWRRDEEELRWVKQSKWGKVKTLLEKQRDRSERKEENRSREHHLKKLA